MFDLGNTLLLETDLHLFPHVISALNAVKSFTTTTGEPLALCIVTNLPAKLPVARKYSRKQSNASVYSPILENA